MVSVLLLLPRENAARGPTRSAGGIANGDWQQDEPEGWSMSLRDYTLMLARTGGLNEAQVDRIISCESGWNPTAANASSTAYGLAQFLTSTWEETKVRANRPDWERDNPVHQAEATVWLMRADGFRHWVCR